MKTIMVIALLAAAAWGTTYSPVSGDLDSIQKYVALADTGDTVNVPAGEWAWKIETANTPSLTLPRPIYLKGAGHTTCIIECDTTGTFGENCIYHINKSDRQTRISGIRFIKSSYSNGQGIIRIGNKNWRVDHCSFDTSTSSRGIVGVGWGLIDSCYFGGLGQAITLRGVTASGEGDDEPYEGDSIWHASGADILGDTKAIYIENCIFKFDAMHDGAFDAYVGASVVFRYNAVYNTAIGWHGYDSGPQRGLLKFEIYNNAFVWTISGSNFTAINARSGFGVVYNNSVGDGYNTMMQLNNYRSTRPGPGGDTDLCDGSCDVDGDSLPSGWPCRDQIGRGVNQSNKGVYFWNNTGITTIYIPNDCGTGVVCDTTHIKIDRDYFTSEKIYTAYDYPHPLRGPIYKHVGYTHTILDTVLGIIKWNAKAWVRVDTSSDHATWVKFDSMYSTAGHIDTIAQAAGKYHRTVGRSQK